MKGFLRFVCVKEMVSFNPSSKALPSAIDNVERTPSLEGMLVEIVLEEPPATEMHRQPATKTISA